MTEIQIPNEEQITSFRIKMNGTNKAHGIDGYIGDKDRGLVNGRQRDFYSIEEINNPPYHVIFTQDERSFATYPTILRADLYEHTHNDQIGEPSHIRAVQTLSNTGKLGDLRIIDMRDNTDPTKLRNLSEELSKVCGIIIQHINN